MIYFGKTFTSQVSGSVWKEVQCEGCQCEFVYRMSRTGRGRGSSPYYMDNDGAAERAERAAVASLQKQLEHDCDAVACPDCDLYQANMVRRLRRQRWGWLNVCGWIAIGATLFIAWIVYVTEPQRPAPNFGERLIAMPMGAMFGSGVAAIALSWIGRLLYDPNATAADRVHAPETTSEGPFRRAEFEVMVRDALAREEAERHQASAAVLGRRVFCPHCEQSFATSSCDRCPLCHGDWITTPPQIVG